MMNALTAVYGLPAGFMIIDVIGVKWSLALSNAILMSARLLLAFTTSTHVAMFVLYFLMPLGQALNIPVLTIAVRRFTNSETRSIAYSWFYVVLNVAALLAAPAVDLMRRYVGGACVEVAAFSVPCFSAYRAIVLTGFFATAINFVLSMLLPLTKEVAMGKGKLEIRLLLCFFSVC
jgi:MFS family permease